MNANLRPLPRSVAAVLGETPDSYLLRLAIANAVTPSTLWSHLRQADPALPYKAAPQHATTLLEAYGGLPSGWFASDLARNLLPRRCPHTGWRYIGRCSRCCQPPAVQSGCLRCSAGQPTQVRLIGPICLRHRIWHFDNTSIPIAGDPEYARAVRILHGRLLPLGVAAETGELQLAARLLTTWTRDRPYAAVRWRWHVLTAARQVFDDDDAFWVFPEAVALAQTLTDPAFVSYLLSPAWSATLQVELLTAAIAGIVREEPPIVLSAAAAQVIAHSGEGVHTAYNIAGTRARRHKASFERALLVAARSHRACLLRHLDTVRLPSGNHLDQPRYAGYVSRSRVLVAADSQPDADEAPAPDAASFHCVRTRWSDNPLLRPGRRQLPDVKWA